MEEFLNENKIQFKDLTDEEKLLIINEKMKGNVELIRAGNDMWSVAGISDITFNVIYRTKPKPAKKIDIPWQFIKPEFKWVAMDENGNIYLHVDKPVIRSFDWYTESDCRRIDHIYMLNIDTTGVDWKTSLTQRPDGG